jgi:hypothetical protein
MDKADNVWHSLTYVSEDPPIKIKRVLPALTLKEWEIYNVGFADDVCRLPT